MRSRQGTAEEYDDYVDEQYQEYVEDSFKWYFNRCNKMEKLIKYPKLAKVRVSEVEKLFNAFQNKKFRNDKVEKVYDSIMESDSYAFSVSDDEKRPIRFLSMNKSNDLPALGLGEDGFIVSEILCKNCGRDNI